MNNPFAKKAPKIVPLDQLAAKHRADYPDGHATERPGDQDRFNYGRVQEIINPNHAAHEASAAAFGRQYSGEQAVAHAVEPVQARNSQLEHSR